MTPPGIRLPAPVHVALAVSLLRPFLTQRGQHRSAGAVDLLVTVTTELQEPTLLHRDRDFECMPQSPARRSSGR